jgi:2-polyprenyl-3-methyl-5-hydroxy-6-metoxy-1,4-benzoquinol methylase
VRVTGTGDLGWFLSSGQLAAETIRETATRHGRPLDELQSLLDFGCGSGRITRWWRALDADVHGSDADARAVRWCRANLVFARFASNGRRPPLAYDGESFDLVYAISVFTHLTEELQRPWLDELRRVLRPGGLLVISTHGAHYLDRMTPAERATFEDGGLVVRWRQVSGTNLCAAYHPSAYVERLAEGFALLDHVPEGAGGSPHQDLFALRRV